MPSPDVHLRAGPDPDPTPSRATLGRSRVVAAIAVVVGAGLVAATLRVPRGSLPFYTAGYALAFVWIAAAGTSGDLRRLVERARPIRTDIALGAAVAVVSFGAFVVAAVVGRHVSFLAGPIDSILGRADAGPVGAVLALAWVNAVAEELFFRGVLIDAVGDSRAPVVAVVVYVAVTAVAGNTALTLAAAVMGIVWTVERVRTGGRTASITTHLVWSTLMILALPR